MPLAKLVESSIGNRYTLHLACGHHIVVQHKAGRERPKEGQSWPCPRCTPRDHTHDLSYFLSDGKQQGNARVYSEHEEAWK